MVIVLLVVVVIVVIAMFNDQKDTNNFVKESVVEKHIDKITEENEDYIHEKVEDARIIIVKKLSDYARNRKEDEGVFSHQCKIGSMITAMALFSPHCPEFVESFEEIFEKGQDLFAELADDIENRKEIIEDVRAVGRDHKLFLRVAQSREVKTVISLIDFGKVTQMVISEDAYGIDNFLWHKGHECGLLTSDTVLPTEKLHKERQESGKEE